MLLGELVLDIFITFDITKLPYSQDVLPDEKPRMICGLGLPGIQLRNSSCLVACIAQWMCLFFYFYILILTCASTILLWLIIH